MTEWQSIESAPKHTTIIATDGDYIQLVAWKNYQDGDGWFLCNGLGDGDPIMQYDEETGMVPRWWPTHWIPMPEPPK